MNERLSRIKANVRFSLWKAKTYHPTRYISFIILIATLAGASFFASNNTDLFIKRASAAVGATYAGGVLTIDGGGNYMLLRDPVSCGAGSSLWPLNFVSSNVITNGTINNFKGRLCVTTADSVIVQNSSILSLVGDISVGQMTVNTNATVTTAPSDAHGKAAPYSSRPNYFANRFTGFIRMDGGPGPLGTTYKFWPSKYDDAVVIEHGVNGSSVDGPATFAAESMIWDKSGVSPCSFDVSFRRTDQRCGAIGGNLLASNESNNGSIKASIYVPQNATHYIPIRVSHWEIGGDAVLSIGWQVDNGINQTLPVSLLYAPYETEDGSSRLGKVDDANGQNKMRFEYGAGPLGGTPVNIARDLSNSSEYSFFSRVNLRSGADFAGFGKSARFGTDNDNFNFYWAGNSDHQTAGSPLSNAQRDDGLGFRLGAVPPTFDNDGVTALLQNYVLMNEGINGFGNYAELRLTTSGDIVLLGNGRIDVSGKGLPGGIAYRAGWSDRGVSGVGGKGSDGQIGMWRATTESCEKSYASHWNIHGGGGGGGGKCTQAGPGGGGGGVIGYGAAGYATDVNGNFSAKPDHSGTLASKVKNYGAGGAGLRGVGGNSTGNDIDYYMFRVNDPDDFDRSNGSANVGSYTSATITGMGGGGGQGATGEANENYPDFPAGNGGGSVVLSVGGSLTINSGARVMARGENTDAESGAGAGGAGTIDITVKGTTFDLYNNAFLYASGGATFHDTTPNGGNQYSYPQGGQGGGGLIKLRAKNFGPTSGSGWPTDYCAGVASPFNPLFGPNQNIDARAGQPYQGSKTQAGDGLVDIRFIDGSTYCVPSTGGSGGDVQISKRLQQWSGAAVYKTTEPEYRGQIDTDGNWVDSVTTVPSTYLRVQIVIRNPSKTDRTVIITDTVPSGVDLKFAPTRRENVEIRTNGTNKVYLTTLTRVGEKITVPNVFVAQETTVEVMYVVQVNQI